MSWTVHVAGIALGKVSEQERDEIEGYLLSAAVNDGAAIVELERDGEPVRFLWSTGVAVHFTRDRSSEVFMA